MSKNIVIIGNGIAGSQLSVKLLQYAQEQEKSYKITVIAAHDYTEISMNMTRALAEGPEEHNLSLYPMFQENGIKYAIAIVKKLTSTNITLDNGQVVEFDVCIVCTGQKHQIFAPSLAHRTIASRQKFISDVHNSIVKSKSVVIAGGGGVGCETAADIKLRHKDIG